MTDTIHSDHRWRGDSVLRHTCPGCVEDMMALITCASEAIHHVTECLAIDGGKGIDWLAVVGALREANDIAEQFIPTQYRRIAHDPAGPPDRLQ